MNDLSTALQDMLDSSDFDAWFFSAKSNLNFKDGQPLCLPLATELLFGFCDNNDDKFANLCAILEQCFNAGIKVGESK